MRINSPSDHEHTCYVQASDTTFPTKVHPIQVHDSSVQYYRPVANSTPLGLCAFATTAFAAGMINAELIPAGANKFLMPLAFFYGGCVLFFAGVWELIRNNTFGGTAFCSYGAFWIGRGFFDFFVEHLIPAADLNAAKGSLQLVWTVFSFIMMVGSFRTNVTTCATFVLIVVASLCVTIGKFQDAVWLVKIGGWAGMLYGIIAWYGALSNLIREVWKEDLLPIKSLAKPATMPTVNVRDSTSSDSTSPRKDQREIEMLPI